MVSVLCSSHICITVTKLLSLAPQINGGFAKFTLNSRNLETIMCKYDCLSHLTRNSSNPIQLNGSWETRGIDFFFFILVGFCFFFKLY